jgi:hypothetical protein
MHFPVAIHTICTALVMTCVEKPCRIWAAMAAGISLLIHAFAASCTLLFHSSAVAEAFRFDTISLPYTLHMQMHKKKNRFINVHQAVTCIEAAPIAINSI